MATDQAAADSGATGASNWQAMPSLWMAIFAGAVTVTLILLLKRNGHDGTRRMKLPPGPRNWPVIGAFLSMDPVLHKAFEKLAAQYGPVVHFRLGAQTVVLVSSAEAAEELLKDRDAEFAHRGTTMNRLLAKYTGMDSAVMAFADYDNFFKLYRKISMTELFTAAKIRAGEELRGKEIAVMVEKILSQIEQAEAGLGQIERAEGGLGQGGRSDGGLGESGRSGGGLGQSGQSDGGLGQSGQPGCGLGQSGQPDGGLGQRGVVDGGLGGTGRSEGKIERPGAVVAMREAASDMIQNIVFKMFIGRRFDDLANNDEIRKFPRLLEEQMAFVMKFNLIDFFHSLEWLDPQGILKDMKKFNQRQRAFFQRILERQRQAKKTSKGSEALIGDRDFGRSSNFVDTLLQYQEEGDGEISNKVVLGTALSMWMAGIHTTAAQIEWVLLELVRHPNYLQRLQLEINGVVGKERPVQQTDLQAVPFLNAIVMETLRLHPISTTSFLHVNMSPCTLGGFYIPSNTAVILNIQSIARDPQTWSDPLEFNPKRFMIDPTLLSKPTSANGTNYHLLTFGSGRRMCPGYNLAMMLLLRTVATLVHALDLSPPGCNPKDLSVEEGISHIQQPISDLILTCKPNISSCLY